MKKPSMNRKQRRRATKLGQIPSAPAVKTGTVVVPPGDANLLGAGLKHHQAGRLAEAEACYRRVLAAQPDHADALHLLGVVAHQTKRHDLAVELISQAIKQNGQNAAYFCNLGIALKNRRQARRGGHCVSPSHRNQAGLSRGPFQPWQCTARPGQARRGAGELRPGTFPATGLCRGAQQSRGCPARAEAV